MSIIFPSAKFAQFPNADFLNSMASFSFACWVRYETITTANKQYAWSHAGATNQISCRKDSTSDKVRFSVTAGSVAVTRDSVAAISAATKYHLAGTWKPNDAAGMALYLNGALEGTSSTTTQSVSYDSLDATTPLCLAAKKPSSDINGATVEALMIWKDRVLTAAQVLQLYYHGWPHLVGLPAPAVSYPVLSGTAQIPDASGNSRHIVAANISSGVTEGPVLGRWRAPRRTGAMSLKAGAVAPSAGPWILDSSPAVGTTSKMISGLTPGTLYEVRVLAVDAAGNVSPDSALAQAYAQATIDPHVARPMLFGHGG
jgi:hypothetical protein